MLSTVEANMDPVRLHLKLLAWALRKFRRYTEFAVKVYGVVPSGPYLWVVKDKKVSQSLRGLALNLLTYPVELVVGARIWDRYPIISTQTSK